MKKQNKRVRRLVNVQLLLVREGRAVEVSELLRREMRRVRLELKPPRGSLDAWFKRNALDRAKTALEQKKQIPIVRSYRELQGYVD